MARGEQRWQLDLSRIKENLLTEWRTMWYDADGGLTLGPRQAQQLAVALSENRSLKKVQLEGNIGDEEARILAASMKDWSLTSLKLNDEIRAEGARVLADGLKSWLGTHLDLSCNSIGDSGASSLAACLDQASLRILRLAYNKIGDLGAISLAFCLKDSCVTDLDLGSNEIGDSGAGSLAANLKSSCLRALNLRENCIREEGALALLHELSDSPVLRVHLHGNQCSRETRKQINTLLEALKASCFILQMQVKSTESVLHLTLRTVGGTVAAVLPWNSDRRVQDLPKAVWAAMQGSACLPSGRYFGAANLRIVLPGGTVLDAGRRATCLARQLGLPVHLAVAERDHQPLSSAGA